MSDKKEQIYAINPHRWYDEVKEELHSLWSQALVKQKTHGGEFCQKVETELSKLYKRKHAVLVHSGTSANILMLLAKGIGAGDEVIVTPYVCPAGVVPIKLVGAQPIFVDLNKYGSFDVSQIEKKITSRTKAIFGIGLYGDMYDFDAVDSLCKKHNLIHFNDACQVILGDYKGKEPASLGDVASISFGRNKNMPIVGTYGAVLTDDDEIKEFLLTARFVGQRHRNIGLETLGINAEPSEDKAVQCFVTLKYAEAWQARRLELAKLYEDLLAKNNIPTRQSPTYSTSNYHKMVIFVNNKSKVSDLMAERNIDCPQHYTNNHATSKVLNDNPESNDNFPVTDLFIKHALSLPLTTWTTEQEVERVVENLVEVLDTHQERFRDTETSLLTN